MSLIDAVPSLPERDPQSHKGDYGHVFILAGSPRMTGAALLTMRAALRSGAGLVTLGIPDAIHPLVAPAMLCAMTLPLPSTARGTFSAEAIPEALEFAANCSAVALGPGITTEPETATFVSKVSHRCRPPMVIDADGLNCLARAPRSLHTVSHSVVLTPHPGEAARLLETTARKIQEDRRRSAIELAEKYGAVVALKGHGTIVTDGESIYLNDTGNPGMATGGSGDVLTGIIAAALAAGLAPFDAAVLGVHVHGLAGDIAAKRQGEVSLTAEDMVESLGEAFRHLSRKQDV